MTTGENHPRAASLMKRIAVKNGYARRFKLLSRLHRASLSRVRLTHRSAVEYTVTKFSVVPDIPQGVLRTSEA